MKTVEEAHRAGARDGKAGVGAIPPKGGPPGSLAQRMRDAYLQSYRDANVAKFGVKRERNRAPKRKRRKRATCVRPSRAVLYAQRRGGPLLAFMGRGKFATRGRPKSFESRAAATAAGWVLRESFPRRLKGYRLFAK